MNDFTFMSPTRFVFGRGITDSVGEHLAAAGYRKALVVYGQGSVVRCGTLGRVKASLEASGLGCCELAGVRPNPEVESVRQGIAIARSEDVDVVLAIGGGSAIDCAKAVSFGVFHDGDVWDFFEKRAAIGRCLPVACVLTIPAAGSEASDSCVISNDAAGRKTGVNSDSFRPVMAFFDPELTFTLPPYQTAAGVTDMIAHILERYFSGVGAVPVTDNIALGLVAAIMEEAPAIMADPEDYDARANIMWAGTLAHNGIAGIGRGLTAARVGDWSSHALEHELSAFDTSITHGAGLAVIMPAWMRYVWREDPARFLSFAHDLFGIEPLEEGDEGFTDGETAVADAIEAAIDELQEFFASLGMPRTLGEFGLKPADVDALLPTLKQNKGEVFGAFKKLTCEDAKAIYLSAF